MYPNTNHFTFNSLLIRINFTFRLWFLSYLSCDLVTAQPVHPANDVENVSNNAAAVSTSDLIIGSNKELPTDGEDSVLDSNKSLEVIDNSLEVNLNAGFKSASGDINKGISESDLHSSFEFGEVREVEFWTCMSYHVFHCFGCV